MKRGLGAGLALLFAIAAAAAAGCVERRAREAQRPEVKVEVGQVGVDRRTGAHYVVLRDRAGRSLPIAVGDQEARAIMLAMHGIRMERPLTDQLLSTVLQTTGNHLDRAVVSELRQETYFAYLELDDGRYKIDCRPSDAIALAMDSDAPIYVNERLLQQASLEPAPAGQLPPVVHAMGLTVQELTPELAGYFDAPAASGLLVIDAEGAPAAAGVTRGDVITRLDGAPLRTLEAFDKAAAGIGKTARITLVVKRAGAERTLSFSAAGKPGA